MLRGQNPTVGELGFWALWDWMALYLLGAREFDVLADALNAFADQLSLYRTFGIPRLREMGSAPLAAVTVLAEETEPSDSE
jgi:hypothetical protein